MKKLVFVVLTILALAGVEALAKALEPTIMLGPLCPAGSARVRPFLVFEDRNGDGGYDFITAYDCNGDVRGRPWEPTLSTDPFIPLETDLYIGHLPDDVISMNRNFYFREEPSGLYSWGVIEFGSGISPGGNEICRTGRDANMVLSTTCPAYEDEGSRDDGGLE